MDSSPASSSPRRPPLSEPGICGASGAVAKVISTSVPPPAGSLHRALLVRALIEGSPMPASSPSTSDGNSTAESSSGVIPTPRSRTVTTTVSAFVRSSTSSGPSRPSYA